MPDLAADLAAVNTAKGPRCNIDRLLPVIEKADPDWHRDFLEQVWTNREVAHAAIERLLDLFADRHDVPGSLVPRDSSIARCRWGKCRGNHVHITS